MRSLSSIWLASALSVVPLACVPEFDDDASRIESTRILAVRSIPAEAGPGDEVELEALIASPEGAGGATSLEWALCLARKPLTELGPVARTCIDDFGSDDEDTFVPLGSGPSASATLPTDVCRQFGPLQPPAEDGGVAGRPVDPDLSGGYYQPVVVGAEEAALGSIRLLCGATGLPNAENVVWNRSYRPNENPSFEELTWYVDGELVDAPTDPAEPIRVTAGSRVRVEATFPACPEKAECGDGICSAGENATDCSEDCEDDARGCAGAEVYVWADTEARETVERLETLEVSWFASRGRFENERSEAEGSMTENDWRVPDEPGSATLWFVVRDDRGGVGWASRSIVVD